MINPYYHIYYHINEEKTEYMSYNLPESTALNANGKTLKKVNEFKYLGCWVNNSANDFKIRKGQAWNAMGKLDNVWKSNLPRETKINFFRATDESILLYGSETWTTTEKMIEHLDGTYTRLLRHTLNINWSQHITNEELYGNLPKISKVLKV